MHLPWKKHRISQLVADLHSPSNRRRSLLVQTGFPTSLVDLFVKNRDRLRKTSLKKRSNRRGIDSSDHVSLAHSTPPAVPVTTRQQGVVEALEVADNKGNTEVIKRSGGDESCANSVSVTVLRTFVVVAMALGTKKLVVGITLSAFVLLLLEYAGKHVDVDVSVFFKPCLDAKERLFGLIRWMKKALMRLNNCNASKIQDSVDEIGRVGASIFEEGGADLGCGDTKMIAAKEGNEDKEEEVLLIHNNNSRICRIKSNFIRRFVPKKLRALNSKKKIEGGEMEEEREESSERSSYLSIDTHEDCGEHELECQNNEYDHEESETPWSRELSRVTSEKVGRAREGNSGCLIMLVLIVLVGLFGGRIRALVLTLVWCLVLRFVGNARAYENVPMVRSLVAI